MTTDPTRAAEIVVRAEKAIALGKATGSDGSRLPSNIYVIAEELLALVQRPTDTVRAGESIADAIDQTDWSNLSWSHQSLIKAAASCIRRFERPATPSPVTDETALSGEPVELDNGKIAPPPSEPMDPEEKRRLIAELTEKLKVEHAALASTPQPVSAECPFCTGPVPDSPLQKLGAYLADVLDDDRWATAEQYLNAAIRQSAKGGE
jgi:hypothetical protein